MNSSLEYIKKRINEGDCNNMPPEEFNDMNIVPFKSLFLKNVENHTFNGVTKDGGKVLAYLTYEPDAEFNYFITESCVCDGTLMFMGDLMERIVNKICQFKTCYAPALDILLTNEIVNYDIHYAVGDFITNSYIVESPDKDKPWMCDRFTVMLPVKFTLELRK